MQQSDTLRRMERSRNGSTHTRDSEESLKHLRTLFYGTTEGLTESWNLKKLESLDDAFWKRLPVEAKFRIGVRLFGL